jgi:hypothetical protein
MRVVRRAERTVVGEESTASATNVTGSRPKQVETAAGIVFDALPGIVEKMVEKALEGSCQHAKFVFDLARVAEVEMAKDEKPEPWVEELLTALRALPDGSGPTHAV